MVGILCQVTLIRMRPASVRHTVIRVMWDHLRRVNAPFVMARAGIPTRILRAGFPSIATVAMRDQKLRGVPSAMKV